MSRCAKSGCKFNPWRGRLCFTHWKLSQGFAFDRERKVFVKSCNARTAEAR